MVHIAIVAPVFVDRGKSVLEPGETIEDAVEQCIKSVTSDWYKQRKAEERDAGCASL